PSITLRERERRLKAAAKLQAARTLRFYVLRYDEEATVGRGHTGVSRFVERNYRDAREGGFPWKPSAGAILRAVDNYGTPGERALSTFITSRGRRKRSGRWDQKTCEVREQMVTDYWSDRTRRICDVSARFYEQFDRENKSRETNGEPLQPRPSHETLRLWIK